MNRSTDSNVRGPERSGVSASSVTISEAGRGSVVLDDLPIAELCGRPLPSQAADLVDVAAAVQFVDRSVRRPPRLATGDSWSRELCVQIGVRDVDRWSAVSSELTSLLTWLTDDQWQLEFTARAAPGRRGESVRFLFDSPPEGDSVALYSGGVDSIAGLSADLVAERRPVLVSALSIPRLGRSQKLTLDALVRGIGRSVQRVPVRFYLRRGVAVENSQRARGFGFLALAASLAAVSRLDEIRVYENGVGAINLPYTPAQAGAHGTRAMHPETLGRAGALFSKVLDAPIRVTNPCQMLTKAQMCERLPVEAHEAIAMSHSCDTAFSHRASSIPDCGECTSCLLRRQSLWAAGLSDLDGRTEHRFDAFSDCFLDDRRMYPLRAMLVQVAHLTRALEQPDRWRALVAEFPDLTLLDPSDAGVRDRRAQLIGLLGRYAAEWRSVPSSLVDHFLPAPGETSVDPRTRRG